MFAKKETRKKIEMESVFIQIFICGVHGVVVVIFQIFSLR